MMSDLTMRKSLFMLILVINTIIGLAVEQEAAQDLQKVPTFLEEPLDVYYIVDNNPVTITCTALGAVDLDIKCGGSVRSANDVSLSVDPSNDTITASTNVTREEIFYVWPVRYRCECIASDRNKGTTGAVIVKSKPGVVELAYLKKIFERAPTSVRVEVDQPAQLQCIPPEGRPVPEVLWFKDWQQIGVNEDTNFLISGEGNLLIMRARLSDTGNYTCNAVNVAARRSSEAATLTVFGRSSV